ncbi:MAG: hypothetical protein U5L10_01045 [Candidatus Moranbacteria bacterium]|nr:hypothetical protein [Candidatus Moranbacteria bacterium]
MTEKFPNNLEKPEEEKMPDLEEVRWVFKELLKGEKPKETAVEGDEKGLLLVRAESQDADGDKIELEYTREGQKPSGAIDYPVVSKVTFAEDGMPIDGFSIRKIDGAWQGI